MSVAQEPVIITVSEARSLLTNVNKAIAFHTRAIEAHEEARRSARELYNAMDALIEEVDDGGELRLVRRVSP